jgi:hypothetical protein
MSSHLASGTMTITPSSGESVSLQANDGEYEVNATDGSSSQRLTIDKTVISAIAVVGSEPAEVSILGVAPSIAWTDSLTVTLTHPDSTLTFDSGNPVAPISFGTSSVTATAPLIAVRQEITAASSISLTGTAAAPSIHADVTAAPTGAIILNGARVTTYGFITLAAGSVQTIGPVVGATGCFGVEIGCRGSAPSRLTIDGNLITDAPWSDLAEVQVTGAARLGGDVTTSGVQEWQDAV